MASNFFWSSEFFQHRSKNLIHDPFRHLLSMSPAYSKTPNPAVVRLELPTKIGGKKDRDRPDSSQGARRVGFVTKNDSANFSKRSYFPKTSFTSSGFTVGPADKPRMAHSTIDLAVRHDCTTMISFLRQVGQAPRRRSGNPRRRCCKQR